MKVLTATHATQGQRTNDFDWCVDGELVMQPPFVCGTDLDNPDGGCGCGRSWAGLNSERATTTAIVADVPLSLAVRWEPCSRSASQRWRAARRRP